jgi:hypothetical protein
MVFNYGILTIIGMVFEQSLFHGYYTIMKFKSDLQW